MVEEDEVVVEGGSCVTFVWWNIRGVCISK